MADVVLDVSSLSVTLRRRRVLDSLSLKVSRGEVVGITGANGSGKSTLLSAISRYLNFESGRIIFMQQDITRLDAVAVARLGVMRSFQETALVDALSVEDNLRIYASRGIDLRARDVVLGIKSEDKIDTAVAAAVALLSAIGLSAIVTVKAAYLSTGQRKMVSLAGCFASGGDLLLLDEPTAGLSYRLKEWLGKQLEKEACQGKTVLLTEHDAEFLGSVCTSVERLDRGRLLPIASA